MVTATTGPGTAPGPLEVTFMYFDSCPNWVAANAALAEAAAAEEATLLVSYVNVSTPDEAERLGFGGSPTVLVDGVDPFAGDDAPVGFGCRVLVTPEGRQGVPSVEDFRSVLRR